VLLSYDSIEFKILRVTDYVRQAVYTDDWTSYLFDHVSIRCLAWINPAATAFLSNVPTSINDNGFGMGGADLGPVSTELFLVSRLYNPRKQLAIWLNSDAASPTVKQYVLVSPFPGRSTDARFGPQCKVHSIKGDHGNQSFVLDLEFTTDINPIEKKVGDSDSLPLILANRWKYRVTYDKESYAEIRIIEGTAHVRMDTILSGLANPKFLNLETMRGYLVPSVPVGFQRETPTFEFGSGGDVLEYVVVDRQTPMSMPLGNAYKIANMNVEEQRRYSVDGIAKDVFNFFGHEIWTKDFWTKKTDWDKPKPPTPDK